MSLKNFEKNVPKPFQTMFCNNEERFVKAKALERRGFQIDLMQANKFCAMIIYHDPKVAAP